MKKILKFVGYFLLVVLVLLLTLPIWIGWVVKPIANSKVSALTGANFNLGEFGLNPYTGCLHVGDLQLSNPTNGGYDVAEKCVELGRLDVDLDMGSVFSEKIVISSVEVEGLTIRATAGGGNFGQIGSNAAGEPAPEGAAAEEEKPEEEKPAEDASASGKKVQIDRLVLKDLKLKIGVVGPIPVPTLTIEGIGADKEEGASIADAYALIKEKVLAAAGAVGGKLGELGSAAADAVGEGAGKAVGAIGEGAGKAVDAIGEGAGKAVDAVKGLFK